MQTHAPRWQTVVGLLVFALLCGGATLAVWRSFGGSVPLQARGYPFSVDLKQASNLQVGAAVRVAGVDVGHVTAVTPAGRGARVTAELERRYVPLHADAHAIPRLKSLLGEAYLQMTLGTPSAPAVPDGGRLAAANVADVARLDDVLDTFDPATRAGVRTLAAGWARALRGRGPALSDALGNAPGAAGSLADAATALDHQRSALSAIIDHGGAVLEAVGRRQGAVRALITQGDAVFAATAARDRDLTGVVRDLPPTLAQLRRTAGQLDRSVPALDAATRALVPPARALRPALTATRRALPSVERLFNAATPVLRTAHRGLPAATRTVRRSGPTLAAAHAALRSFLPALQFLAVDPNLLIAAAANLDDLANPYVTDQNGNRQHYAKAVPLVWNEIVGGLSKQLPSSRQNPYPRPGSLGDLAHGGLRAWSCDNVHNPPVVPVIPPGTGAPPCLLQGPYDYRGHVASYPRLLPSPP
ncbi:MlaD family protein [Paraconexibacter antarcticus]|uniref:MlaD family protein n=1 Tax=Paraconexibacter antarcticus TaxID=2949664 RepID=A0ABY5E0E8_9ACTN|nr:MlaD family protein [Paraconexibacter antarcticus]UTI66674.1 MlaD family protein [Paraconexibacter antarcticus]